jgi:hypothetical protein
MDKISEEKRSEIVKPFVKLRASQDQDANGPADVLSHHSNEDKLKVKGVSAPAKA